jgi:phosphopantothenoylcysteine decarboxylase/phosphopantothenate--cysteine ligase
MALDSSGHWLRGRHVVLGVCGGIAAYKAAEVARLLTGEGAEVQVVTTRAAREFVGDLTWQALTGRAPRHELFDPVHEAAMGHIELARWADLVVVAPATADVLARLAAGLADDLLTTLCLATGAPLVLAPAMNQAMWRHPATVDNVARLQARGALVAGPAEGAQACGDVGPGRMLEPSQILDALRPPARRLAGRSVLITAGPTREAIDPVRFIGNRSSGKMGFAVAAAAAADGASVTLVAGPVTLDTPPGVARIDVESAEQMHAAVMAEVDRHDIFVACAAVADFRPDAAPPQKIKKDGQGSMTLRLLRTPDILADVAARTKRPFCVGFAAETQDVEAHAERKRVAKGLDMVVANEVGPSLAFDRDDNALTVLWSGGRQDLPRQPKPRLAARLIELIADRYDAQTAIQGA